jgi:hypothetical protein
MLAGEPGSELDTMSELGRDPVALGVNIIVRLQLCPGARDGVEHGTVTA